ncbi:unnamed protein product [Penicillium olsonii]|nr:unnamed protein product [Penicillium olsonii]
MARLNTANPLVHGTPHRGSKDTPTNIDSQRSNQPCCNTRSPTKYELPKAQNQTRRQLARSSTFNILPDDESASECEIGSQHTGKQTRPRTLGLARVNSLLLPKKQRPRPNLMRTAGYDKENDVPERSTDEFRTPGSTPTRPAPARPSAPQISNRARERPVGRRQPVSNRQREDSSAQNFDDSFDSLDDFIVSDNEEPSSHEESDHETPDTEEEPTPPPSPAKSPRKRLLRGRRPPSETEPTVSADATLPADMEDPKPSKDSAPIPTISTATDETYEPKSQGVSFNDSTNDPESEDSTPYPLYPQRHNSEDLIKHLENLDLSSDEEDNLQPQKSTPRLDSDDELPSPPKPSRKQLTPLTPSTSAPKDTPPTTIRAQKKAEAARKREIRAQIAEFNENKVGFAEEFLRHLESIFDGRIGSMTKDTGGIKLVWTKNFRNTAGRATVRSERVFLGEGVEDPGRRRYNATIELSEKVLDTEDKILCTLTHEYCHLLDILITENRGKGAAQHGVSFKQWGARCTQALKNHPVYGGRVEVTTKHTYEINHKYVWACVGLGCPFEVGRHSKSVDPVRHRCGRCRGHLKQIKPVPRAPPKKNNTKIVINLDDD